MESLVGLKSVSVSVSNPFFIVEGDFVLSKDRRKLIHYFGCSSKIVISKSIELIGDSCFMNYESLSEIFFESDCNLKGIGKGAFSHSGLKAIRIPSKVEFIGESCFYYCKFLSEVIFENDCNLRRIDELAFHHCPLRQRVRSDRHRARCSLWLESFRIS
jgi:hypothetical protein